MSESLPTPLISPAPLVTSDEGKRNLKTLVDGLLDRQVPDGQRKGSFNAVANSSYYFDYTAPLALLSAYKHSDASPEQKEQYLEATKKWLAHSHGQLDKDGMIKNFSGGSSTKPAVESSAGVLWVASKYSEVVKDRPDKKRWLDIVPEMPAAFNDLLEKSLGAIEKNQREDGLMVTSKEWSSAYYTSNVSIHTALQSAAQHSNDQKIKIPALAVDLKLLPALKTFSSVAGAEHIPFVKGGTENGPENFQQLVGHEIPVDGYSGMVVPNNKYIGKLKAQFEEIMSNPQKKEAFFAAQTLPMATPLGLQASGYKNVTIDGKDVPLSQVMEEQVQRLAPNVGGDYIHKIALTCIAGYEGCDGFVPLQREKEAAPSLGHEMGEKPESGLPNLPPQKGAAVRPR